MLPATCPASPRRTSPRLPVRTRRRRRRRPASPRARAHRPPRPCPGPRRADNVGVTGYRLFRDGSQVGTLDDDDLRLHRSLLCDDLRPRRGRGRCRRQRLRHRNEERHDHGVLGHERRPRHRPASRRARLARPPRPCPGRRRPTTSASPATGCSAAAPGRDRRRRRATSYTVSPAARPTRSVSPRSTLPATSPAPHREPSPPAACTGHHPAVDADRPRDERDRADLGDPVLDRVDRQRRRHRLPGLPGGTQVGHLADDELQLHRSHLRYDLHTRRRRGRRLGQRLRHRDEERHHDCLPGHDAAVDPDRPRTSAVCPDRRDAVVDGVERQRRRDRLSGVPGRHAGREPGDDELRLHRSDLRHDLHARRRRGRRRRATSPAPRRRASRPPPAPTRRRRRPRRPQHEWSLTDRCDAVLDGVDRQRRRTRATARSAEPRQVGSPTGTGYAFSGLSCGTTYSLGVAAVDGAGNASGTATTSVTTSCIVRIRRRRRRRPGARPGPSDRRPSGSVGTRRPTTWALRATGSSRTDRRWERRSPRPSSSVV